MSNDREPFDFDPLALQRLVDNELTEQQVRQLVTQVEFGDDPTAWKKIALCYIESQMFERAFGQKESPLSDNAVPELAGDAIMSVPPTNSTADAIALGNTQHQSIRWPMALAIGVMLTILAAYQFSIPTARMSNPSGPPSASMAIPSVDQIGPEPIKSFDRKTLASYKPDHQLNAKAIESVFIGKHQSAIPLYDAGRLNPQQLANLRGSDPDAVKAMFAQVLPKSFSPEVMQQLQNSGGMIDQNLEFISGRLDDGRPYVIPYRTIRFLPGQ